MQPWIRTSLLLAIPFFQLACGDDGSGAEVSTDGLCTTPLAPDEPPCSAAFGDTAWPASHRGSYAQGSSALPGPAPGGTIQAEHIDMPGAPVIVSFTAPYEDGGRSVWSTALGFDAAVVKVDHETFELIDTYIPAEREDDPPSIPLGLSGAYTAVDSQNRFIVGRDRFVSFFGDSVEGDRRSPIELKNRIFMPPAVFCGPSDLIAGMSLTYDNHLAFATERGNLFVIPADADPDDLGAVPVAFTNDDCEVNGTSGEAAVSNSIAVDENGGIYMVTSDAMYRFDWDGTSLLETWRADYDSDEEIGSTIRLGPGSGSTPSLMGTAADDDRFVVITDGRALMHLVLFWRDEIPSDWEPIAPGKDRRIACEVPIRFGDPDATEAISEQSVAVRGYAAVVVNDLLNDPTIIDSGNPVASLIQNVVSPLEGGIPEKAPFGLERVDWDPLNRTCATVWANPDVSVPNGIPSISAATGLVYGIGQREGQWGLEGLDLETGESVLWAPGGSGTCPEDTIPTVSAFSPIIADILEEVPNSCENSFYAATTVAPDGMIYTGTFAGMSRYVPDAVVGFPVEIRIDAGLGQALDLLNRAETDSSSGLGRRELLLRALVQLRASENAAAEGGLNQIASRISQARPLIEDALATFEDGETIELQPIRDDLIEARSGL